MSSYSVDATHSLIFEYQAKQQMLRLKNRTYTIGRQANNDIVIPEIVISRHHCTLFPVNYSTVSSSEASGHRIESIYWIIDGDLQGNLSSNGLFVNGQRCLSHELRDGDRIEFSGSQAKIIYRSALSSASLPPDGPPLDLPLKNLSAQECAETNTLIQDNILTTILEKIILLLQHQQKCNYAQFEIDLKNNLVSQNTLYSETFPFLGDQPSDNPFIKYLVQDLVNSGTDCCFRQIRYRRKAYIQYSYLAENSSKIRSCIFDFDANLSEKNILESEEKYRSIVRQTGQGILLIDPQSLKIIEANNAYCYLLGYTNSEINQVEISHLLRINEDVIRSLFQTIQKQRLTVIRESIHYGKNEMGIPVEENIRVIHYSSSELLCLTITDLRERKAVEQKLAKSLADKELLLKEIHHRVKNNLLMVSSLLNWQGEAIQDPSILKLLADSQKRINSMALIHEALYRSTSFNQIDLANYLQALVTQIARSFDGEFLQITFHYDLCSIPLNIETITPIGLIINELVINVYKHAFPHQPTGHVFLSLTQDNDGQITLIVQDDGVGYPESFNFRETASLGWQLICLLCEQLEGQIQVNSVQGSEVILTFKELNYQKRL
jgi:PAS domain S-box-containing protein